MQDRIPSIDISALFGGGPVARAATDRAIMAAAAHTGFLTLLAQDGVEGLQARHSNGDWMDVPPREGTLTVNFGKVLEQWCEVRIKATEHRVIGTGRERRSIPSSHGQTGRSPVT